MRSEEEIDEETRRVIEVRFRQNIQKADLSDTTLDDIVIDTAWDIYRDSKPKRFDRCLLSIVVSSVWRVVKAMEGYKKRNKEEER